ncbi:MAG: hypothetical protein M1822_002586 [Bathelium mastoideum]|nr:MAG: hypothetical protein M1822_002586 [Bathelium mastoideum]
MTSKNPSNSGPPPPSNQPPNGGTKAWLQMLGSWCLIFNTWNEWLVEILICPDNADTKRTSQIPTDIDNTRHRGNFCISWIGVIQALLSFAVGAIVGPIYDRGWLKLLLFVATFCIVFDHMMPSLCIEFREALLAQGFLVGTGGGCLLVPSLAVMQPDFGLRLSLAVGLAATGSSIGDILYPAIFTNPIDKAEFRWMVRVIGFVALATLLVPLAVSLMRSKPPDVRKIVDPKLLMDGPYLLCILACLLGYIGCYPSYYISYFGLA